MDEILEILTKDARTSSSEIAKMTNKSEEEVKKIISRYEKDGTILKYKALLNPDKVSENKGLVRAWIEVNIIPERGVGFDSIAERIYKFDEVKNCYLLAGRYDLLLLVEGESLHDVAGFVAKKLSTLESITKTATHFLLKVYKENGDIMLAPEKAERLPVTP